MAKLSNYKEMLKDKNYVKLLFSNLINRFGDSIDAIAFTWLVYDITKSASWAALIFGLNILPNVVLQPFLGALVEKLNKKNVIVFTHVLRFIVISGFVAIYLTRTVTPLMMVAFTLLITSIESLNLPASTAFIQNLIKKENMSYAISLNSSLSNAVAIVGKGLAGVIIATLGVGGAMFIDAATFLLAGLSIMAIRLPKKENDITSTEASNASNKETKKKESFLFLLKDGIKYILKDKIIINITLMAVMVNFMVVPLNSLQAPIASECFKLGSELLSVMGIAASLGGIVGSLILPIVQEKFSSKKIITGGIFGLGSAMVALSMGRFLNGAAIPGYLLAGVCFFVLMLSCSIVSSTISVQFLKTTDPKYIARAAAVLNAACSMSMPIASLIVSGLAVNLSADILIGAAGILTILIVLVIGLSKMKFDSAEPAKTTEKETELAA